MKFFLSIAAILGLFVLTVIAFWNGYLGVAVVTTSTTNGTAGTKFSDIGRGNGFMAETEMDDEYRNAFIDAATEIRPKWILTGDEALRERAIDKMTEGVLSNLPPELLDSAKDKMAPILRTTAGIIVEPKLSGPWAVGKYEVTFSFEVKAEYGNGSSTRRGCTKFTVGVSGMYPIEEVRALIARHCGKQFVAAAEKFYADEKEFVEGK
ncbi:MAG: hypothetical protein WC712_01205 [Candidatus Brocadiia bacterium]